MNKLSEDQQFVRDTRKSLGLTQAQFASQFDIGLGTIRLWEIGRRNPSKWFLKYLKSKLEEKK